MLVGCKKGGSEHVACALDHTTGGECDADVRIILRLDWNESEISRLCLLRSAILVVLHRRQQERFISVTGAGHPKQASRSDPQHET